MKHAQQHHHHQPQHELNSGASLAMTSMRSPFSELIQREVSFRRVTSRQDFAEESFIDVYQKAFAGAPYFEKFNAEFVRENVWQAHQRELIIVAEEKGKVIGLLCAHRVSESSISPSACSFIREQLGPIINDRGTIYFSELAVAPSHQGMGVASALVASALTWASENLLPKFILRTAAEGSNSVGIFKKFGARELKITQDVSSAEAGGPESSSTKRVYLAGDVTWQGDYLARLGELVSPSIADPRSGLCYA
jgi:ribosomal protein S18 acetylase RimI-like enzyme